MSYYFCLTLQNYNQNRWRRQIFCKNMLISWQSCYNLYNILIFRLLHTITIITKMLQCNDYYNILVTNLFKFSSP